MFLFSCNFTNSWGNVKNQNSKYFFSLFFGGGAKLSVIIQIKKIVPWISDYFTQMNKKNIKVTLIHELQVSGLKYVSIKVTPISAFLI